MKVYISKYRNHWVSPYTILEKVCFWEKDNNVFYNLEEDPNHKYQKWIERLAPICQFYQSLLDIIHPKVDYVKIDYWDTWSMDSTLSPIILPMLRQLKATKHGAPNVDDEDVPEMLKSTSAPPKENSWEVDANHFRRWDWILDEIIFAFQCKVDDSWQDEYRSGEFDMKSLACEWDENGKPTKYQMVEGPNHTYKCDYDAIKKVEERIANGFKLFGKYYQALWD